MTTTTLRVRLTIVRLPRIAIPQRARTRRPSDATMSAPENLNSFVGRLATFDAPKQLTKRRASTTRKKTATTVSWPHKDPSPEEVRANNSNGGHS